MKAELTATVEGGVLKPDAALPFPEQTRVKLTIEALEPENPALAAWKRLQRLIDERPLLGLAGKFSREELHERD
jgi:predicted DNA-binding antitoxin AbrB/MazE fold protein